MNIQTKLTPRSLLWGCMYFVLTITVYKRNRVTANNITIVPLHNTIGHKNVSSDTYEHKEVNLLPSSEIFSNITINGSVPENDALNDTYIAGNNVSSSTPLNLGKKESKDSRLNLAVIPVVGILVFVTVVCLKCCGWFRQYTRGSKHSTEAYDIVEQGDIDFDQIDIRSDSASTVYYDTVSSFCSFLRRNESDITVNSFKSPKFEQLKQEYNISEKLLNDVKKRMAELDAIEHELGEKKRSNNIRDSPLKTDPEISDNVFSQTETSRLLMQSPKRRDIRTPSASSDMSGETEQSLLSDTEKDTPKRQRFKVSFVTENAAKEKANTHLKDVNAIKPIINNTRNSNGTMTEDCIYRQRTYSLNSPKKPFGFLQIPENGNKNTSSKIVCKVDIEKDCAGNNIRKMNSGARPKVSPILIKRPILGAIEQGNYANITGQDGTFVAKRVLYGKLRSASEIVGPPRMKDCGTQTDKSFRLAMRKGRKRYLSEINADENVIPPTISEIVEMCSCKVTKGNTPISGDEICSCDNSPNDVLCDDVFQGNENDGLASNAHDPENVNRELVSVPNDNTRTDEENRLTNHERNEEIVFDDTKILPSVPDIDRAGDKNRENKFNSDIILTCSSNVSNKLSLSTHNITDIKNDSNGNLLGKYCDKCHNFNKSVPNLCFACQKHSIASDIISKAVNDRQLKNRCLSCSQFSWTNSVNRGKLRRQNNVNESEIELSALDIFKQETSLASDDLSFSSSSLSSSGYVEISSDVSSV